MCGCVGLWFGGCVGVVERWIGGLIELLVDLWCGDENQYGVVKMCRIEC